MILGNSKVHVLSLLATAATTSEAFVPSSLVNRMIKTKTSHWKAATLDETTTNGAKEITTWECDEEAQCVEVPACDDETCRTSLDVRIHGEWYDLTGLCSDSFNCKSYRLCAYRWALNLLASPNFCRYL